MVTRQTRFSDVCGTMDEFKRLHGEEYERVLDDTEPAQRALALLDDLARSQGDYAATGVPEIADLAEAVRSVASSLEHQLRSRMVLALELNKLFLEIKRDRPWVLDDGDTGSFKQYLEAKYQSWLPSEPDRSVLLERLASAGAEVIESDQPGAEPMVQFDDGGSMAMSQVRYDTTVQNFHPANHKPAPGGRLYRRAMPDTVVSPR